jgi:hypothetical protein
VSFRELKTKLSKITVRSGTRQSPTLVINLTKVGSTLSPEERQPLECNWPAYRGTQKICKFGISSMKICGNPHVNSGEHTRLLRGSRRGDPLSPPAETGAGLGALAEATFPRMS